MKKLLFMTCCLFIVTTVTAQKKASKKQQASNLSYSYGAQMAIGLAEMGFTTEEKNTDKFVEGFQAGLKVDSASFAMAQVKLRERMTTKEPSTTPEQAQAIAYAMGLSSIGGLAMVIEVPAKDFDLKSLKEGFANAMSEKPLKFTNEQMDSILKVYFNPKNDEYVAKRQAKEEAAAVINIEAGTKFLAENGKRPGVVTTESGLQYEIITQGDGLKPTLEDEVTTHYHGTLVDGTIIDSSVDRGEPATFPLNGVIKGWQEGVQLMSVGSKYRFFIPQELAYGMEPPITEIEAGSTLIFEVELLEINPE